MKRSTLRAIKQPSLLLRNGKAHIVFWGGALCVALTVILFVKICAVSNFFFHEVARERPWVALILTPLGFALSIWLARSLFPGAEGSGVPQTLAVLDKPELGQRRNILSWGLVFWKILFTAFALCGGASVGPEGPSVQIGASVMCKFSHLMRLRIRGIERTFVLTGAAAGVAAAFNTPLAGVIFAIEALARSFEERTSGAVLIAVVISGIVSLVVLGPYSYFGHMEATLSLGEAVVPVAVSGIGIGLLGGLFSRGFIVFTKGGPGQIRAFPRKHPEIFAALCGFCVAVIGVASGAPVYGTGYEEAKALLAGGSTAPLSFGPAKLVAVFLTQIAGLPGGLFAPSLSVGAGLGAFASSFFSNVPPSAFMLLGMAAFFTGVIQTPLTAVVILLEMTQDQSIALPLMATSFLALVVSRLVCPVSLYRAMTDLFIAHATRKHER